MLVFLQVRMYQGVVKRDIVVYKKNVYRVLVWNCSFLHSMTGARNKRATTLYECRPSSNWMNQCELIQTNLCHF